MLLTNPHADPTLVHTCRDFHVYGAAFPNAEGSIERISFMSDTLWPEFNFIPPFTNEDMSKFESSEPKVAVVHYTARVNKDGHTVPYITHVSLDLGATYFENTTPWSPDLI